MKQKSFCITHEGKIRSNNEDNFYLNGIYKEDTAKNRDAVFRDAENASGVFSVCDGMGGEAFGELASLIAVRSIVRYHNDFGAKIKKYVSRANAEICKEIKNSGSRIGTTFAALCVSNGAAEAYNIGDSRIYLFRGGKLDRLSVDHTPVQRMIAMGLLTEEQARSRPDRHRLSQHLGIFPEEMIIEPYCAPPVRLRHGDTFLLCSDGLTDMLTDGEIEKTLGELSDIRKAGEALLNASLEHGGKDNVTVLLVQFIERGEEI